VATVDRPKLTIAFPTTTPEDAHIQSEAAALLLAHASIPLGPLAAGLRLTGPEVVLDSLHLESQGSSLDARGTIVAAKEAAGSAADTGSSLSIEAGFALSDRLFSPWRGDLPLRGEVRGEARFEVTSQGLVVDARIRSALLRWGDLQAGGNSLHRR